MDRSLLDELIGIWEAWTNGNPLLRQAVQSWDASAATRQAVLDGMLAHLSSPTGSAKGDEATIAAVQAGWAVVLALEVPDAHRSKAWQRMRHDALVAHQEALLAHQEALAKQRAK